MTNHECFYFDRHLKEKQSVKTLVLCKVSKIQILLVDLKEFRAI